MSRSSEDFTRKQIHCIAMDYASSEAKYSAHYFSEQEGITENVFYTLLKRAVVESIVTMDICNQIMEKSAANSERHGGEGGKVRSEKNYDHYFFLRRKFMFKKEEIRNYATGYAESFRDISEFCKQSYIADRKLLERTLVSAIVDNIVDDDVVEKLKEKAIRLNGEKARCHFETMENERKEKIASKKMLEKHRREAKKQAKMA